MTARPDLERLTSVVVADVLKAGRRAATLDRRDGPVRFRYLGTYPGSGGRPVATSLPLGEEPVVTMGGAVPPFFAGLLPEGRRLAGLRQAVKTSADDELSLLLAVGTDTVGDVQVVPAGEPAVAAAPLVVIEGDVARTRFQDLLEAAGVVDPVGLPGVQDKMSARMISVPVAQAGARFVLKVDPPEFPHVVANEAFVASWAHRIRMPAVETRVVHDADGRAGLLVRRFDRLATTDGGTLALACEDACQVLRRWPADKYRASAEEVVAALADRCAARPLALRDLFRQFVFAWLVGNGDLHAKNVSILQTRDGEWRVAPAYDLPATVPYGDASMALDVQGRRTGLSRRHWLAFADAIGLPARAAVRVLDDLLGRLETFGEELRDGAIPLRPRALADWIAELRHRHRIVRAA